MCAVALASCGGTRDLASALRAGDYARVAELSRPRAERGDVQAQTALGALYYVGAGVPRDFGEALRWYERAALARDPPAQRALGSMFRQGLGTPKDDFRAFGWYDAARQQGHPGARQYMQWMALVVGWNQQAMARRWVAEDLERQRVSHSEQKAEGTTRAASP
jgi:TPR repeat protein